MRSTLTARGQTVVPAEVRRKFHLTQADRLEWIVEGNILRVVPVRQNPVDEFRGGGSGGSVARLLAEREKDQEFGKMKMNWRVALLMKSANRCLFNGFMNPKIY